jgi:short-subunit dehydrogenase
MKKFKGKIAVVTGAGSGIGRALALQLASEGAHLALNDFNAERLTEVVTECQKKQVQVFSKAFDVADRKAFYDFSEEVIKHFGAVDLVINNAGVALGKFTALETSYEDYEWIMGINLWGVIYGTKAFLPTLLKREEASIVNISSLFGITGVAFQSAYCTSKFAVRGFTESLRMELLDTNVNVHVVHPGGIKTNIARDAKGYGSNKEELVKKFEKGFFHTPEKAAKVILDGVKNKTDRILIGPEAYIGDFAVRLAPAKYSNLLDRFIVKRMDI